jgi:hypothetical protein
MFVFGLSPDGLVDLKALINRPMSFKEAEGVLFELLRVKAKVGHVPLARARIDNLINAAQRRRREAGNDARFA